MMAYVETWNRYLNSLCRVPSLDLSVDVSRMGCDPGYMRAMEAHLVMAYEAMTALEAGAIANPDEQRMVGHYWLRASELAPTDEIRNAIDTTLDRVRTFAADVHAGRIRPERAACFTNVISMGIGGSALGPMFVHDALGEPNDPMCMHFLDNTDPDGLDRVLRTIGDRLDETLCLVISKSGGTPEPRNAMHLVRAAYEAAGLDFSKHAVAVTGEGSKLDRVATEGNWLARFPMWDWVGGRTSELGAVGLLPAALHGVDIDAMLAGAAACDDATRTTSTRDNPAAMLALMWHFATNGRGEKDMVVLPYKDRLLLFSRYLQQLVMESIGKRLDLEGLRVDQGLSVYGNKGSTDQHAYVQQLRDGTNNFFAVFIRVLEAGAPDPEVEPGTTANDYLHAFLLGTREALSGNDRQSLTITVPRVDAYYVGVLIALFERAVGYYATLVGINAYHQPGVEAGKSAAAAVLELQHQVAGALNDTPRTVEAISEAIGRTDAAETVYALLEHLVASGRAVAADTGGPATATFRRA